MAAENWFRGQSHLVGMHRRALLLFQLFLPIGERFVSLVLRTLVALQGSRCCPPGCRLQQLTRRGAAGERADRLITPDIFTVKSIARTF